MKYIVNESNSCGQASISDEARNNLLEAMGFPANEVEVAGEALTESVAVQAVDKEDVEMPTLYEWDGAVFALDEEVFEIEGDLFLKAMELDGETRGKLDESHAELFINEVKFDEAGYTLGDIYDYGKEIYIKLDEAGKKGEKSDVKAKEGDKPDFTTGARKGDKSKTKPGKKDFSGDDEDGDEDGEEEDNGKPDFLKSLKKK